MAKTDLTAELLRESLHYDQETGVFTRLKTKQTARWCGKPAGYTDKRGYIRIRLIDGKIHKAHRLAWLYVYGVMPENMIDHIDGNPSNNKIDNLREATRSENRQNIRKAHSGSSHGILGACKRQNGKWGSRIVINGQSMHLGTFDTANQASAAYISAKYAVHPFYAG